MAFDSRTSKFNVCLAHWPGPVPFFEAYREVAETVLLGLKKLGYDAILSEHRIVAERINIVFGFQIINPKNLSRLPESTILYHLEQVKTGVYNPSYLAIGSRFTVWDYSLRNCERLRQLGITRLVRVPIGYMPEMSRIESAAEQDIDVLFYGLVDKRRGSVLQALADVGLNVKTLQDVYGAERDKYISRAKVVLNMHLYEARIFEAVRVSYLLENSKAVVSECGKDTEIEDAFLDALVLADFDNLAPACVRLVRDADERRMVEKRGFAVMSSRDECKYLEQALSSDTTSGA